MDSGHMRKFYNKMEEKYLQNILEQETDISELIIPFSKLKSNYKSPDIYSGREKIPFIERDPDYKSILKYEFANNLNVEFKIYKPVIKFPSF